MNFGRSRDESIASLNRPTRGFAPGHQPATPLASRGRLLFRDGFLRFHQNTCEAAKPWAVKIQHHGDDEPSHTIQPNFLASHRIQFAQEREPWFRDAFIRMRRQGVLPSCRSGDSSRPQRASDALSAKFSQLESSSRGKRYLRAQVGLSPTPPNTTEAFLPARSPSCPPTLHSPERR